MISRCRGWIGCGAVLSALCACDGTGTSPTHSSTQAVSAAQGPATAVTITPTKCNPPKVESSDGAKSQPKSCPTITIPIPPASYRAKQQQYLAALVKQQASWKSLSKEQQAVEQLKLKRSILGQ